MSEYLDNLYPENRLQSSDLFTNATHKLLIERYSKVTTCSYKLLISSEQTTALADLLDSLKPYENALKADFFAGNYFHTNIYSIRLTTIV